MSKFDWSNLGPREQSIADGRFASETNDFDTDITRLAGPAQVKAILSELVAAALNGTAGNVRRGTGSPEGVVTAPIGVLYEQSDGTGGSVLWVKTSGSGNTGWTDLDLSALTNLLDGTGSPEGVVTAPVGVIYQQTDGTYGNQLWLKISGSGNTGWRLLQTSLGVFNVKDYGAVGDGVTDDSAAIQAAIDAAEVDGGSVYFPAGDYNVTATLTLQADGVRLVGAGSQATTLHWAGGASKMLTLGQTATPIFRWGIVGMRFRDTAGTATHGLYLEYAREGVAEDVWLQLGFTDTAIYLAGTSSDGNWSNRWNRVVVSSTDGEGVYLGPQTNANIFTGCLFTSCAGAHVVFGQAQGCKFIGCQFEQSESGYELLIDGRIIGSRMLGASISDCYFELKSGAAGARAFCANETGGNAVTVDSCLIEGCFIWGSLSATYLIESNVVSGGARFMVQQCALFGCLTAAVRATNANDFPTVIGYRALTGYGTGSALPLLDDNAGTAVSAQSLTITGGNLVSSAGMSLGDNLVLTAAVSRVVPGVTSLSFRNNANSADNLIITDSGGVTVRSNATINGTALTQGANAGASFASVINGADTGSRTLEFHSAGVRRWLLQCTGAESGSDTGAALNLLARVDAGTALDTVLSIVRAAGGLATWARRLVAPRFIGNGTAHVAGDYALSAGWGNTATVSTVAARDTGGRVSITCGGSGIAANPTVTLTYKDGTWTTVPTCVPCRSDINAPATAPFVPTSDTATTFVLTFLGTPVAGTIYTFSFHVVGK